MLLHSLQAAKGGNEGWQERKKRRKKRSCRTEGHRLQLRSWDPEIF
jgi:hypothetical protein